MGLKEYEKKRDFNKTSEPKGGKGTGKTLRFVIQRHHASHLHYDFRLELDGVLKSWAVPKGPSMNPKDKRLAMMVEDHPYDYRTFEGLIPQGEYGGGVVIIWDEGTYESLAETREDDVKALHAGLHKGDLKFRLHGKILQGEFALVKLHSDEKSWLLIKHKDEFAVSDPYNSEDFVPDNIKELLNNKTEKVKKLPKHESPAEVYDHSEHVSAPAETHEPEPDSKQNNSKKTSGKKYEPMMAKLEAKLFEDQNWFYEHKLDGYRALGYTGKEAKLISRNNIDFGDKYKQVLDEIKTIDRQAVLDGEIVAEDKEGRASFQELQNYQNSGKKLNLRYHVFDLLMLDGHDVRSLELWKRKELLKALLDSYPQLKQLIYHDHVEGKGAALMETAKEKGWEGIIGKDKTSTYESGKRSDRWLKFKLQNSQEAIICGFTKPEGSRRYFGSLVLGIREGANIRYAGNCGTGFNEASLKDLYEKMQPLVTKERTLEEKIHQRGPVTWVKPKLVCEVYYSEWTGDRHLRHPVFKGLRNDKEPEKVVIETPETQLADDETIKIGRKTLKLTNQNKLWWKEEGITKGQLIHYYKQVSAQIIPFMKDKPISMRRQPNGIADEGFFQKDVDRKMIPDWVQTEPLYSESIHKDIQFIIGKDEATLLLLANLGCIEMNPWLSSYKKPDHPDFLVIDLDPHDVPFSQTIAAAHKTKEIFNRMNVDCYIKTSGSKGLHIYCYVGGKYNYDFIRVFAEYIATIIHAELPEFTSIERTPAKRPNKIYIDFLQNRRGQTIAAPYSARPKPGATVSAPLHWHEVNENLKISDFTIFNMPDRVKQVDDPWKDMMKKKADLQKALQLLKPDTVQFKKK
ncbi:DNA ligase D [Mucilaginibacter sp. RS28]|uniref:DNA ligase (ATP) n=1 Tax=Mucilaginibacter straminoryzae TaxID=2932774 RepID=A0A9X1X467_9SPHI|nr:DNA ligase D [Mucilaginibacter straminoryzae]MCJ8210641.1 DNA ligase D [Mucilaginibacter straminoryzae]